MRRLASAALPALLLAAAVPAAALTLRPFGRVRLSLTPATGLGIRLQAPSPGPSLGGGVPNLTGALRPVLPSLRPVAPLIRPAAWKAEAAKMKVPATGPSGPTGPRADFFFNDHDAFDSYREQLRGFVLAHDEIMVESLPEGREREVFQAVSDGEITPQGAEKLFKKRREPMDRAILDALYASGRRVLAEPVHRRENKALRRRIDKKLIPQAESYLGDAYEAFLDGEAAEAVALLKSFNAIMVEVHALRERVLTANLKRRLDASPAGPAIGVLLGMFHTRPYIDLKRAGYRIGRSFHPAGEHGEVLVNPYVRPLRHIRFRRPYKDPELENKETLATLMFFIFLDQHYRKDRYAGIQSRVYDDILSRMRWTDLEDMTGDLGLYYAEKGETDERRLGGYLLRWLGERGFIKRGELKYFRRS